MGILADIYISRDGEETEYDKKPDQFTDRAQYKGITPLELSTLWAIMRGAKWDVGLMREFPCLFEKDGGERLIHRIPVKLVDELCRLTPEQIEDLSTKWAATDEISCPPNDIRPVVEDLARLSRRATESGRGLYLWNCV